MSQKGDNPKRRAGSLRRRGALTGFLFLLPLLLGLMVFRFYGFGYNIYLSFTKAGAFGKPKYIGLKNYQQLMDDEQLRVALANTFKYCLYIVPCVLVVAIICALIMQVNIKGQSVWRAIIFLPAVMLPTAAIMLFGWIFQTQYGLVNAMLQALGSKPISWFGSSAGFSFVVTVIVTFLSFSVPAIILYAGLQDIPRDVYEAAAIDGAGPIRRFFFITLPLLTPTLFFVVLTTTISTLKLFDVPYILLPPEQPAAGKYGMTAVYYYYRLAFLDSGKRGYASAVSLILFIAIFAVSLIMFAFQRKLVNYGEDYS